MGKAIVGVRTKDSVSKKRGQRKRTGDDELSVEQTELSGFFSVLVFLELSLPLAAGGLSGQGPRNCRAADGPSRAIVSADPCRFALVVEKTMISGAGAQGSE